MKERVLVLGGGVIGLSCAYELGRRGYDVSVLEMNRCGGQASGAAAGMLAPYSENVEGPDEFFRLCLESLHLYPEWQTEIKRVSGLTFEYTHSGSLYAAYHQADLLALQGRLHWQRQYGSSGEIVQGAVLRRMEPYLSDKVQAALYTPEESHIYAPHYVMALEQACRVIGVHIYDGLGQVTLESWQSGNGVSVRSEAGERFEGDRLLVCSGAWAGESAHTLGIRLPIYPIRGQICAYETNYAHMGVQPVRHMVFCSQGYLVAKDNSTLVCGASEDVAGFDTSVTDKGINRLLKWNKQLFPYLSEQAPFHRWAGLRPATQDGYPFIGPLRGAESIILAAGHYRNGILLSPVTAKLVADCISGTAKTEQWQAFAPDRFGVTIG